MSKVEGTSVAGLVRYQNSAVRVRPVASAAREPCCANPLGQAADQTHGAGRTERRQEVLIHLVSKSGVADLVQAEELVEAMSASVGHQQPVKSDSQARLSQGLNGSCLAQNACTRRNDDLLAAVRVDRVRDQAVHRGDTVAVQPIRQNGINHRSFQNRVQWAGG